MLMKRLIRMGRVSWCTWREEGLVSQHRHVQIDAKEPRQSICAKLKQIL